MSRELMNSLRIQVEAPDGVVPTGADIKVSPDIPLRDATMRISGDDSPVIDGSMYGVVTGRLLAVVEPLSAPQWGLKPLAEIWIEVAVSTPGDLITSSRDIEIRLTGGGDKILPWTDLSVSIAGKGVIAAAVTLAERLAPDGEPWDRGEDFATAEDLATAVARGREPMTTKEKDDETGIDQD